LPGAPRIKIMVVRLFDIRSSIEMSILAGLDGVVRYSERFVGLTHPRCGVGTRIADSVRPVARRPRILRSA
jgi:hypothetical protein